MFRMSLRVFMFAALVLVGGFMLRVALEDLVRPTTPVRAQDDLYDCKDFTYQEEAQSVYDQDTSDPYGLDGPQGAAYTGEQGVACEELPHRPVQGGTTAGSTTTGGITMGGTTTGGATKKRTPTKGASTTGRTPREPNPLSLWTGAITPSSIRAAPRTVRSRGCRAVGVLTSSRSSGTTFAIGSNPCSRGQRGVGCQEVPSTIRSQKGRHFPHPPGDPFLMYTPQHSAGNIHKKRAGGIYSPNVLEEEFSEVRGYKLPAPPWPYTNRDAVEPHLALYHALTATFIARV